MIRAAIGTLVLATALGGCTVPLNTTAICRPDTAQAWVGQVYTESAARRIRIITGAARYRIIRPGEMTTMEFEKRRVNIALDDAGRVARIYCG